MSTELSEAEQVAKIARFGFDQSERHDHDPGGCTCGCPVGDCAPCGGFPELLSEPVVTMNGDTK